MHVIEYTKIDEAHIKVFSTPEVEQEIKDFFTFKAPGYQFSPKYKARLWNGDVSLFDQRTKVLPVGLFKRLDEFATESKYDLKFIATEKYSEPDRHSVIDKADFDSFIQSLNLFSKSGPITLRDYQYDTVLKCVTEKKITAISPTSCLDPEEEITVTVSDEDYDMLVRLNIAKTA